MQILAKSLLALSASLVLSYSAPATAAGPKFDGTKVVGLSTDAAYVQSHPGSVFWRFMPFYSAQSTPSSCSAATATIALNGMRGTTGLTSEQELFTEASLMKCTGNKEWASRVGLGMGPSVMKALAQRGVTLELLTTYLDQAFRGCGLHEWKAEKFFAESASGKVDQDAFAVFKKKLGEMETTLGFKKVILINFDQGKVMGDSPAGHISPIGAYDSATDRVLIMDVDRKWFEPYWASSKAVWESMKTPDSESKKNRGYIEITRK